MKKYAIITGSILFVLFILSFITPFCNVYADAVYGLISDLFGVLAGLLVINLGECLMYLAALVLLVAIVLLVLLIFLNKKQKFKKFTFVYLKTVGCITLTVLLIYMLNWYIPLHSSVMGNAITPAENITLEELESIRNHFVEQINETAMEAARDEEGCLIYPEEKAIRGKITESMHRLSPEYKRLTGYYPNMKAAYCSDVFEWMNIGGYTYPYTMEITYNRYVTKFFYPSLFAHESAHHQGYYRENEANFIEFLACTTAEDPLLRYAGYMNTYSYINDAYIGALYNYDPENAEERYKSQVKFIPQIRTDLIQAQNEADERYESDDHPMESLSENAATVSDTGWDTQAKLLGENGYDGVVPLIVEYYRKK